MAQPDLQAVPEATGANGAVPLETALQQLFAEQRRLRELLEQTQAEFARVNRAVLQVQQAFCTDEARELEYRRCVERLTGMDPYIAPEELEEAARLGFSFEEVLQAMAEAAGPDAKDA
jgi:hypothetical protein